MTAHSLLLIDDDTDLLKALSKFFEARGYKVYQATSGETGLALWEEVHPEVTVVDLRLPGIGGLAVLKHLRAKHGIVLMLTGYGDIDVAVSAMQHGAENFLTKPIDMPHLEAAIAKAAEKAALRREVKHLRARLTPSAKRRLLQILFLAALIGGSVGLGFAIGGGSDTADTRARRPIPIPIDTVP